MIIKVPSHSDPSKVYEVDLEKETCTCLGYRFNKKCSHVRQALKEQGKSPQGDMFAPPQKTKPVTVEKPKVHRPDPRLGILNDAEGKSFYNKFERFGRQRVGQYFLMRDFLFSTRAEVSGQPNYPSDDPDLVLECAKKLCRDLLDPLVDQFGPMAITYGYEGRQVVESDNSRFRGNPKASQPHQWDRGTFGKGVYARVDILPFCVEDGHVGRYEYAEWIMHNLDVDLVQQFSRSNVYCISIAPKQRRRWHEWVPNGQGDGGSNCKVYMGERFWRSVYPTLEPSQRPKFHPSASGGAIRWS